MSRPIHEFAKITAKGQTTIPKAVRQALGVDYGGRIAFRIEDGRVSIEAAVEEHQDPVLGTFLTFLAQDTQTHPERIQALSPELRDRIVGLTEGVEVDLDAPIEGDVGL